MTTNAGTDIVAVMRAVALNTIRSAVALLKLVGISQRSHECTCGLLSDPEAGRQTVAAIEAYERRTGIRMGAQRDARNRGGAP